MVTISLTIEVQEIEREALPLDVLQSPHLLFELDKKGCRTPVEKRYDANVQFLCCLLRICDERPSDHTADKRDELAPSHVTLPSPRPRHVAENIAHRD